MGAPQIVIAEDEGGLRSLIAELLEARDLKVLEAEDGKQAYELLRKNSGVSLPLSDAMNWSRRRWTCGPN